MSNAEPSNSEIEQVKRVPSPFDTIRSTRPDGSEFWSARAMMPYMGYTKWQNMKIAVGRAEASCAALDLNPVDHVTATSNMVNIGSGVKRLRADYELTRYGCYLVAMNGDSHKSEVAESQRYFATMTRLAEVNNLGPQAVLDQGQVALQEDQAKLAEKFGAMVKVIDVISEINDKVDGADSKIEAMEKAYVLALTAMRQEFRAEIDAVHNKFAALGRALGGPVEAAPMPVDTAEMSLASEPPEPVTVRIMINNLVRRFAEITDVSYQDAWNVVYEDLQNRYHFNARLRAKNSGLKSLDVVEKENRLDDLHKVVSALYSKAHAARIKQNRKNSEPPPQS